MHTPQGPQNQPQNRPQNGSQRERSGWSYGEEGHLHLPRHELPSEHLHLIDQPGAATSPAWDEPGYPDPDRHHEDLPEGTRYWQGYSKSARPRNSPPGEERPLSPGFVARITRKYFVSKPDPTESDPNWPRRTRELERDRFSRDHTSVWPG